MSSKSVLCAQLSAVFVAVAMFSAWAVTPDPAAQAAPLNGRASRHTTQGSSSNYVSIVTTDLAVGMNRFAFGVILDNHPLKSGTPHVSFYYLHGGSATLEQRLTAHFSNFAAGLRDTAANSSAVEIGGVFVTYPRFNRAGSWGAEVSFSYRGHTLTLRPGFAVRQRSLSPSIGSPAPRSNNPTIAQEPATKLDSGRPPDDMHRLSIARAIAQHKPLLVLFATAAFCTSRMCGPEIETVQGLERQYRSRVNFVHIEIYENADPEYGYAPAVKQWHLVTEPWVFIVDRRGIIRARFEGPTPASEIKPALNGVVR